MEHKARELFKRPRVLRAWFLPEKTRQHLQAARRERLLALRSLLDTAIERLEKDQTVDPKDG